MSAVAATSVGQPVADLELSRAWLVDPAGGREGPGEIIVTNGVLEAVNWLEGDEAAGVDERGVVVAPAFTDLHAHFREPGNEAAETIATGTAAAAHGGFGTVCLMPNTDPPVDGREGMARLDSVVAGLSSPVRVLAYGAVTARSAGEELAPLGEKFDPHRHEAMTAVESDQPANTVLQVLQKGYLLSGRVIRPARVILAKTREQAVETGRE